jgi:HK97 family phage portal protein
MAPMAQDEAQGRVLDYRVGYNLSLRPREDEAIGFHHLRALADACNFVRLVIETRKDQMERLSWAIQPRLRAGARPSILPDPRIAAIETFLRRPDGHNSWATWLRQLLEELLVTDAVAIYRRRNAAGQLYGLQQIDGATIKRVIDENGMTPAAPDPAYQQILHGLPAVDYTADQLLYLPRNPRIHKLYGFSPVEQVVMTVNIALRRAMAQLNYFTEGNIPEALIACPPDWRPAQIREMQEIFDDMLRGNLATRSGAKFVPGGLNVQFTKDALLKDEFDEWLIRIICYAFSVPPTAFVKQTNRATADNASDTAMQEGLAPLQSWVKALIDRVLAEDFAAPDLEFQWNQDRSLSPADAMSVATGYVAAGLKTRNEARADLGLGPLPGGDIALVTTATGLVPIAPTPLGKDWHFDPSQPRDDRGRWTAGGGSTTAAAGDDEEDNSDDARVIPVQEIILPFDSTEYPDFEQLKVPWDEGQIEGKPQIDQQPNPPETAVRSSARPGSWTTIIDPETGLMYRIPDDGSEEEKEECKREWLRAYDTCKLLDDKRELGPQSKFGLNRDQCMDIIVRKECGGI